MVLVVPFDLSSDLMDYYYKLLEIAGVTRPRERLYFIWPEYCHRLPAQLPLARQLVYSSPTVRRIRRLTADLPAHIVPGYPSLLDNTLLSHALDMPLL